MNRPQLDALDIELAAGLAQVRAEMAALAEEVAPLNAGQKGKSWSLPVDPQREAIVPVWRGRRHWVASLTAALEIETGTTLLRRHHTSAATVLKVAAQMALYAHSGTGRGLTLATATLAGLCGLGKSAIERARRVLRDLGFAAEMARGRRLRGLEFHAAQAHHGGYQSRAASVWHLTLPADACMPVAPAPRRTTAAKGPLVQRKSSGAGVKSSQVSRRDDLSRVTNFQEVSYVGKYSPTRVKTRAAKRNSLRSNDRAPRPLLLQRAAAQLVSLCAGIEPGPESSWHIGQICDVIRAAGIDVTRYSGRDIKKLLDADTVARGWSWPNSIDNPAALLRARLAVIDFSGPSPTEVARQHVRDTERARDARRIEQAQALPADPAQRASARAMIAEVLRRPKAHHRSVLPLDGRSRRHARTERPW